MTVNVGGRLESGSERPISELGADDLVSRWELVIARTGLLEPVLQRIDLSLSAQRAALEVGMESGQALTRWLRSRHLPPFKLLRDWYYVAVLSEHSSNGCSLATFALQRNQYPSIYYRFVDRVTGHAWRIVRQRGVGWVRASALQQWAHWT